MADELQNSSGGQTGGMQTGGGGAPLAPSTGAISQPAPSSTTASIPAIPTTGGGAGANIPGTAGAVPGGTGAGGTAEYMGVREALAAYGIDLRGQCQDDHQALQHLAMAYQQSRRQDQLSQYGQLYLQHADQFQGYLRQQQEAAARQQQEASRWWSAPEYDPRWLSQITRDPQSGELRSMAGAPPDVVPKYLAWQEHQRSVMERLAQDPIGTLRPGLEQVVREQAQAIVREQLGGYQERTAAQGFVERNSAWLFQANPDGTPNGGQLSALGQRFGGYVQDAVRMGIPDVRGQERYAMALIQRDYLLATAGRGAQQQSAQQQQQQANEAFLQQAAQHRPNVGGSVSPPAPVGNEPSQNSSLPLRERLMANFRANGFQESSVILPGR